MTKWKEFLIKIQLEEIKNSMNSDSVKKTIRKMSRKEIIELMFSFLDDTTFKKSMTEIKL